MELLVASGQIEEFGSQDFDDVRDVLTQEFSDDGPATRIVTADVSENQSARRRTRLRGLVRAINGSP